MFTIQPAGVHLALVLAVLAFVAMARTRLAMACDLPVRGTVPVQRSGAGHLALAVGDASGTGGHTQNPQNPADEPHCIICGDPVEGEPDDWGHGPEHLDCHHDDVEHDADADAPPVPPDDEVDPDLITAVLDRLDRPGMMAALTGWNWDDSDYTRAAAFIRAAVEAARAGGAA